MIRLTDGEIRQINMPHNKNDWIKSWTEWNNAVANAQLKKVVEELTPILVDETITMGGKVLLITDFIVGCEQSLLDEVKEA